ncbi:chemotaxis protein CheW [uncultured Thiohalocapsa sp.]|uniref:chemotaxis protein CheW n=1 Tax=uncultured Thiohalocapsa sp. TaxID=768990 RepID=UPI0025CC8F0D|nr:chemotaxis protein CheW [uncultured Thiohalocapsa sp.]
MDLQRNCRVTVYTVRAVRSLIAEGVDTCLGLPRLTPLEQTAPWVLGAFELRGDLVPVVSLGVLRGEPIPSAAVTDLVLVVLSAGYPLGLHSTRPVRIESLAATNAGRNAGHARRSPRRLVPHPVGLGYVDLSRLRLTGVDVAGRSDAEARLAQFERHLSAQALERLEQRTRRYAGDFAGPRPPPPLTQTPAQQR